MRLCRYASQAIGLPIVTAIVLALAARSLVQIYAIPSASMSPALEIGDHIVVTPYRFAQPSRGDVVVFRSPSRNEMLVKRIIATPGDLIESRLGRIIISGHALAEPYLREPAASGAIQAQIIPSGCYFVMGDNRANSIDSRSWGVLPRELIAGRARMVLFSSGDGSSQPVASASTATITRATRDASLRIFTVIH